jgi:hypothetical protein
MKKPHIFSALAAALVFGAVSMSAQMLLLRRFLWRFETAEAGVALFLSCWLFWIGMGAVAAATPYGRKVTGALSKAVWLPVAACAALYFAQYALIENLRGWLGVQAYESFPLPHLALGCLIANAPFCFVAGLVIPTVCRCLGGLGVPVSRAFAWEALGAAVGGLGVTLLLFRGLAPDPRDEAEWFRFFPQAVARPGRFETGGGTTFYGAQGGSFYALSSGGVSEVIPEGDRAMELAVLLLSQRPYAKEVLLLGRVPLAAGLALESLRPDLAVVWCPCDAAYGVRLLAAVRASGVRTRLRASGETPQRFLGQQAGGTFDGVLVAPPAATTLEGASWRQRAFALRVRQVTRRTGVALFGLDCASAAPTPEKCALLDLSVRGVRHGWPESGVFAAGAGGWWIAAQVPHLAYEATNAAARFAMLKREGYPAEAVERLYDSERARRLARECPVLDQSAALLAPDAAALEEVLAAGLADAVRRAYPETTPGAWLARVKSAEGVRVVGLLLVMLWMAPVALGARAHAPRRLLAAWLASCGALGLAVLLAVLYQLQLVFGSLYLLAGAASSLYLAGLFCGNRLAEGVLRPLCMKASAVRWALSTTSEFGVRSSAFGVRGTPSFFPALRAAALIAFTLAQVGVALCVCVAAEQAVTAVGLICLCFVTGGAAGSAMPVALAVSAEDAGDGVPAFAFADAVGAAVAGLVFVLLVPLAGLWQTAVCFGTLACGVALCAAVSGCHARLTAGLALVAALVALGGRLNELRLDAHPPSGVLRSSPPPAVRREGRVTRETSSLPGIPRRLDVPRIRELLLRGQLATNTAVYWE